MSLYWVLWCENVFAGIFTFILIDQMRDFFGWTNAKMTKEFISTSKAAIFKVAQKLQDTETKDNLGHINVAEKACKESSKLANESAEVAPESQVSDFGELWIGA